jgi:hypothetical protein
MAQSSWRSTLRRAAAVGAAYAAWIVASALGGLDILLLRAALNQVYVLLRLQPNAFHFIDRLVVFVAGAVWFFLLILGEGYFLQAVDKGSLRRLFFRVVAVLGGAALVLYLIPVVVGLLKLA